MNKRHFISGLVALSIGFTAQPVFAKASLKELNAYLNALTSAKSNFTQTNPNGSKTKGVFMLSKPAKMRFEYSGKNKSMVIAQAGKVYVFDAKSNTGPKIYPTRKTPLNLILARKVNLQKDKLVYKHTGNSKTTSIYARDPKHPEYGSVQIVFKNKPLTLTKWVVTEKSGKKTTVVLRDLKEGVKLPRKLFDPDRVK